MGNSKAVEQGSITLFLPKTSGAICNWSVRVTNFLFSWAMLFGLAVGYGSTLAIHLVELGALLFLGGCLLMTVVTVIVVYGFYALRRAVA